MDIISAEWGEEKGFLLDVLHAVVLVCKQSIL